MAKGVRDAEDASKKLSAAEGKGNDIVAKASREAESMVAAARMRADDKEEELVKQAESKAENILADATLRAEEANRLLLQKSEQEITKAAMLAAEKILRKHSVSA